MKVSAKILLVGLALVGLAAIGIRVLNYAENPKSYFSTYKELVASGLVSTGWLPPYLPKSIIDISETHSIDSNRVWATFKYDPVDISSIESNCRLLSNSSEGKKYVCPPYEKQVTIIVLKKDGTGNLETAPNDL